MKSSRQVREEIVDVAARLFARYGFRKTSIDDVAAAARIGKGSIYLHFASKEEIFAEVVRRTSDRALHILVAAVKRARSPAGKVRAFIATKQAAVAKLAREFDVAEDTVLELLPVAREYRRAHEAREHALLGDVLREGNVSGAFAVGDPDRLATGLLACLTALETSSVVERHDPATRAGFDELLSVLLRGLGRIPPAQGSESSDLDGGGTMPSEG